MEVQVRTGLAGALASELNSEFPDVAPKGAATGAELNHAPTNAAPQGICGATALAMSPNVAKVLHALEQLEGKPSAPPPKLVIKPTTTAQEVMDYIKMTKGGGEEGAGPELATRAAIGGNAPIGKSEFKGMEGSNLLNLFREDPDAFMSLMNDLKPHDRQMMTMRLQDEMQSQTQLFNLVSNLQQAEHQTSKAIIANIRG